MLQFDKSRDTNKNAVYLESVNTGSGYYENLVAVYSQSYDNSNGTFEVFAESLPALHRPWLVFVTSGSFVPSPTGQYDVDIYTNELQAAIWGDFSKAWSQATDTWIGVGENQPTDLIYSDRAYIVGSNDSTINQYASSNENGTYITYNG